MFMHIDGGERKMGLLQIMLWLVYPYAVVAVLGMGLIWQAHPRIEQDDLSPIRRIYTLLNRTTIGLMLLSFLTGTAVILFNSMTDEPEKLFYWVRSLVYLDPDLDLISSVSLLSRTHFLLLLTFLFLLPFSKYIRYLWPPRLFSKQRWTKDSTNIP